LIATLFISTALAAAAPKSDPCKGSTTLDVNACLSAELKSSEARLDKYLQAALTHHGLDDEGAARLGLQASQQAFEAYRSIECQTVYENWKGGTIRTAMGLICEIDLTDQRTLEIWQQWLTYKDSTPPILPKPEPTKLR
jgi:uncharacterized protein YecT (DUF1311 family)